MLSTKTGPENYVFSFVQALFNLPITRIAIRVTRCCVKKRPMATKIAQKVTQTISILSNFIQNSLLISAYSLIVENFPYDENHM
jgi:hypothetical protein